jgi:hypothetical protein
MQHKRFNKKQAGYQAITGGALSFVKGCDRSINELQSTAAGKVDS